MFALQQILLKLVENMCVEFAYILNDVVIQLTSKAALVIGLQVQKVSFWLLESSKS